MASHHFDEGSADHVAQPFADSSSTVPASDPPLVRWSNASVAADAFPEFDATAFLAAPAPGSAVSFGAGNRTLQSPASR